VRRFLILVGFLALTAMAPPSQTPPPAEDAPAEVSQDSLAAVLGRLEAGQRALTVRLDSLMAERALEVVPDSTAPARSSGTLGIWG
jgi:hypothetical protein